MTIKELRDFLQNPESGIGDEDIIGIKIGDMIAHPIEIADFDFVKPTGGLK